MIDITTEKTNGLSPDLIVHPGETLWDLLEAREMKQKELAKRLGVTEKHISDIINGQASITANLADDLEYVFGVEPIFWLNLQSNYEAEMHRRLT